jgi:DNA-binding transcriptional LysR family regulator
MKTLLSETTGLLSFLRTVETGTFSAAARDLKSTPSGTSKSIARLEALLGVKLFRRSTRVLTLTQEGQDFLQRITPLIKQLDAAAEIGDAKRTPRGRLRVSMPTEIARLLMDAILTRFLPLYPDIELDLGFTDRFVDVIKEDYDLVFRVGNLSESDLTVRNLVNLEMVVVASPDFIDRWGQPDSQDALRELPFARYSSNGRPNPIQFADGQSFVPKASIDLDSAFGVRLAAIHGIGVAYLMRCIVADDLKSGTLVSLCCDSDLPLIPFQAVHAFGRMAPARVRVMADFVAHEIRGIRDR